MANYYTLFSCDLDVGTRKNAKRAIRIYDNELAGDDGQRYFDGFQLEIPEDDRTKLWIYSDESGDVDLVVKFVLRCAEAFDLKGRWGFEYANTCSRPLLDGFGGGAHAIDLTARESLGWTSSNEWLSGVLAGGDPNA